ncbi:MAG: hypothetical protein ACD_37C00661G0003, partial [uncultured bacterium]
MFSKLKSSLFLQCLISISFYLISIAIVITDPEFQYRWIAFFLWLASVSIIPIVILFKKNKKVPREKFSGTDIYILFFIFTVSLILNFSFLEKYPFVSIYDQVRDGGLNAAQIADGTIKNIFSYGRYASHGLIIPTITSFFYAIFGASVFTFRVPSALLMSFSTVVIYLIMKKYVSQASGFFSAIIFGTLPLVLYYSRTEVVVSFSTFLFTLIFLLISSFIKHRKYQIYILGGLLLGFSSGFHTSIRTMALICMGLISLITLYDFYKDRLLKKAILSLILLFVFFLVGFGPRILFTTPDIFLQTRSFVLNQNPESKNKLRISEILNNYSKSLLVYISEPTLSTHYPDFKPVLSPLASIFFILGIIFAFTKKNRLMKTTVFFALIIPFSNSAITDTINSDNRFGPLFVIASLLSGFGIASLSEYFKNTQIRILTTFVILLIFIGQAVIFFDSNSASKNYSNIDYLSMQNINFIKKDPELAKLKKICIYSDVSFYDYSMLYHVQEQYQFFLPKKSFYIAHKKGVAPNELYLSGN